MFAAPGGNHQKGYDTGLLVLTTIGTASCKQLCAGTIREWVNAARTS